MKVQFFVAIAKHEDEEIIVSAGNNARLVEIARDGFISREDHFDWKAQTQTFILDVNWVEEKTGEKENA